MKSLQTDLIPCPTLPEEPHCKPLPQQERLLPGLLWTSSDLRLLKKKKKESGAVKENLSTIESRALSLDRDILHIRQSQTGTPVRIWLHNFNVGDFCTATPF